VLAQCAQPEPQFLKEKPMALKKLAWKYAAMAASVLLAWLPARAQDGPVSPQEIQANRVGKTAVGVVGSGPAAGKPVDFTMNADGSASVSGAAVDSGTWRLSEQGYCATWKRIRNGQERCFTVVRKGTEFLVVNPDGSLNTTVSQIR
jgi:hypothetical protein